MKNLFKISLILSLPILLFSCSNDDDAPAPVNEEEIITTITATLTPTGGGSAVTLQSRDLDGDGPNDPIITVSGNLSAQTTYSGAIIFLNETVNPAEDITVEVNEEADEHQVFFVTNGGLEATFSYENFDDNGNPLGTLFSVETGAASTGNLNIVLRHEPAKPNDGTLGNAGGETDISVNFPIIIE